MREGDADSILAKGVVSIIRGGNFVYVGVQVLAETMGMHLYISFPSGGCCPVPLISGERKHRQSMT